MSVASFALVWNWEDRRRDYEFNSGIQQRAKMLQQHFKSDLETIRTVGDFLTASQGASSSSFRQFVARPLERHASIEALAWIPRITDDERNDRFGKTGDDSSDRFEIRERSKSGQLVPSPKQAEYFPIDYIEPALGYETAVGFNLASSPTYSWVLSQARKTGKMVVTGLVEWNKDRETMPSLLVALPIYYSETGQSPGENTQELQGFILGVLRLSDLFEVALGKRELRHTNIYLCDDNPNRAEVDTVPRGAPKSMLAIYESEPMLVRASEENALAIMAGSSCAGFANQAYGQKLLVEEPEEIGSKSIRTENSSWTLYVAATSKYRQLQTKHWRSWSALLIGLLWTSIPVTYLLTSLGRTAQIENLALEQAGQAEKLQRAFNQLAREKGKSERLLLNILPKPIADRLKQDPGIIADSFPEVTVLFADIVGFTKLAARIEAREVVKLLNEIFSAFDQIAVNLGLEKIKTIGDAYMVVGGLPVPRSDHTEAIANMALDMQECIAQFDATHRESLSMRIGIHTGPVVAGVIGANKFIYDLWGDTVNIASRMESHGIPGCIQVSTATYEQLKDKYLFEERGTIRVKGKGDMTVYLLVGKKIGGASENSRYLPSKGTWTKWNSGVDESRVPIALLNPSAN
ncbi:MAG: guanylate cyclase [Oscillatoria sp. SIO1A7]|nr:guanylate cyclase [Oscillatoria sp. SIO1A7]